MQATWKDATLDDVCERITDGAHASPKSVEHGLPMASVKDMTPFGLNLNSARRISEDDFAKLVRQGCKPLVGDVLIAKDGATALDTVCLIQRPVEAVLLSSVAILRPKTGIVLPQYLRYYLDAEPTRQYMKASFTTGAAIPRVVLRDFKRARIRYPDQATQRRIASILSAYDDLIENNTRRIAILEEMARRLYEEWFVRFRFPGHEGVPMVESELGLVPQGWSFTALGDLVDDMRDTVNPDAVAPDTPYVGLEHIPRRSIALADWGQATDVTSTKLRFREGDILFGKIRPYFHKVAVAPVAGVASSDAIVIRAKFSKDFGLALAVVSSDAFVAHATQTSNGTKMPRANWGVLRQYPVPTPPDELQAQFNDFVGKVVATVGNYVLRNRNLRTTRDLLLPKLISGELDVSTLPEALAETI